MKILNISHTDWANFQYDNMKALRSVGLECDSLVLNSHTFYGVDQSACVTLEIMQDRIANYDIIQFFHDNLSLFNLLLPAMVGKKIIPYHTSSYYRANPALVNATMNIYAYKSVNAMPEFMGMGAHNEFYMVGAIDTDAIKPNEHWRGLCSTFAHYPSNPEVKGTESIKRLMAQTNVGAHYFRCSTDIVSYADQLTRMQECDIYIEMFTDKDGLGSPYGDFGITALEAAAMGKIVVTNFKHAHVYKHYYHGFFAFCPKTEAEFISMINEIACYSGYQLEHCQALSRMWVEQNHSYKATGNYFLKNVLDE